MLGLLLYFYHNPKTPSFIAPATHSPFYHSKIELPKYSKLPQMLLRKLLGSLYSQHPNTPFRSALSLVGYLGVFPTALVSLSSMWSNFIFWVLRMLQTLLHGDTKIRYELYPQLSLDFLCLLLSPKQIPHSPLMTDLQVFEGNVLGGLQIPISQFPQPFFASSLSFLHTAFL